MPSQLSLNAAYKIQAAQASEAALDVSHMAAIIEQELGLTDAISVLIKCDRQLEQLGVSVTDRDFILKALAKLEGSESKPPADAVIGTAH